MPKAKTTGRRSKAVVGTRDSGFFNSSPLQGEAAEARRIRRSSTEELIKLFCAVTGHRWPLNDHGRRALEVFLFFFPAAHKDATPFEVERIRVAESIVRRTQSGEQPGRLHAQIEAAAQRYHSSEPAAQRQAVEQVITLQLLIAQEERRAIVAEAFVERGVSGTSSQQLEIGTVEETEAVKRGAAPHVDDELVDVPEGMQALVREVLAKLGPSRKRRGRSAYGVGRAASELASAFGLRARTPSAYRQSERSRRARK